MKKICPYCGAEYSGNECKECGMRFYEDDGDAGYSTDRESGKTVQKGKKSSRPEPSVKKPLNNNNTRTTAITVLASMCIIALITAFALMRSLMTDMFVEKMESSPAFSELADPERASEKTEEAKKDINEELGIYSAGDYHIGEDMPAGTYLFVASLEDQMFYQGIYKDPYQREPISEGWRTKSYIAELPEGAYLHFSWSNAYDLSKNDITNDPHKDQGMFRVGKGLDLEPGTYQVVKGDFSTLMYGPAWTIYSDLNPVAPVIADSGDAGAEITVYEGDYLQLNGCIIKE